jgi:hypothetical protein
MTNAVWVQDATTLLSPITLSITANITNAYVCGDSTKVLDNSSLFYRWGQGELYVSKSFASAPAANSIFGIFGVVSYDGTNYQTPGSGVTTTPAAKSAFISSDGCPMISVARFTNSSSAQKILLPKWSMVGIRKLWCVLDNLTGVTANADGSNPITLKIWLGTDVG